MKNLCVVGVVCFAFGFFWATAPKVSATEIDCGTAESKRKVEIIRSILKDSERIDWECARCPSRGIRGFGPIKSWSGFKVVSEGVGVGNDLWNELDVPAKGKLIDALAVYRICDPVFSFSKPITELKIKSHYCFPCCGPCMNTQGWWKKSEGIWVCSNSGNCNTNKLTGEKLKREPVPKPETENEGELW